jgi:hypothetical protein
LDPKPTYSVAILVYKQRQCKESCLTRRHIVLGEAMSYGDFWIIRRFIGKKILFIQPFLYNNIRMYNPQQEKKLGKMYNRI